MATIGLPATLVWFPGIIYIPSIFVFFCVFHLFHFHILVSAVVHVMSSNALPWSSTLSYTFCLTSSVIWHTPLIQHYTLSQCPVRIPYLTHIPEPAPVLHTVPAHPTHSPPVHFSLSPNTLLDQCRAGRNLLTCHNLSGKTHYTPFNDARNYIFIT